MLSIANCLTSHKHRHKQKLLNKISNVYYIFKRLSRLHYNNGSNLTALTFWLYSTPVSITFCCGLNTWALQFWVPLELELYESSLWNDYIEHYYEQKMTKTTTIQGAWGQTVKQQTNCSSLICITSLEIKMLRFFSSYATTTTTMTTTTTRAKHCTTEGIRSEQEQGEAQ